MRRVRRMLYYAGRTPKFSAQSHYYVGHIRHNVYFFQSGQQLGNNQIPEACLHLKYSGVIFHDACAVSAFSPRRGCHSRWRHKVWHQWQYILPESGMMDFRDVRCFVGQSGAASVVSGDLRQAAGSMALGCVTLAPHFNFQTQMLKSYFWSWWWYTPPGCKPDASEPTLFYKASLNNTTRTRAGDLGKLNVVKTEGICKNKHWKLLPNQALFH